MHLNLTGKTALVTGASRGIGKAIAAALAGAGAEVVMLGNRTGELPRAVAEVGSKARALQCDLNDLPKLEAAIAALSGLDILVNNAGTNIPEPLVEVTLEHYTRIMDLNLRAAVFASQFAVRKMLARGEGGSIINITSQMGHIGDNNRTIYCASKHALEGFTKALAVELAPQGIRVNSVAPTFIETDLTRPMLANPDFRESVVRRIPMGHVGQPQDVAGAVVFLASAAARLITGTSLKVDGGWTAQ
jgi:NAD(P)-dependent dehydrogenase (short-subunit alcohol dehydrogenase family)